DLRNKQFFMIDDIYLNGYAKILGPHASCIYFSLCRHADKEQSAFPSQELIAKEFNMSSRTVRTKLAELEKWNIIKTERVRNQKGKWLNNIYYPLDKSAWKKPNEIDASKDPSETVSYGHPSETDDITHRKPVPTKDTHNKETH